MLLLQEEFGQERLRTALPEILKILPEVHINFYCIFSMPVCGALAGRPLRLGGRMELRRLSSVGEKLFYKLGLPCSVLSVVTFGMLLPGADYGFESGLCFPLDELVQPELRDVLVFGEG